MSQFDGFLADSARIGSEIRAAKAQADDAELALRRTPGSYRLWFDYKFIVKRAVA